MLLRNAVSNFIHERDNSIRNNSGCSAFTAFGVIGLPLCGSGIQTPASVAFAKRSAIIQRHREAVIIRVFREECVGVFRGNADYVGIGRARLSPVLAIEMFPIAFAFDERKVLWMRRPVLRRRQDFSHSVAAVHQ